MLGDGHSRIHLEVSQISWRHFKNASIRKTLLIKSEDLSAEDYHQDSVWLAHRNYSLLNLWALWPHPGLQFPPATTQMHILCILGHLFLILLCLSVLMNFPSFTKLPSKLYQCHSIVINSFMSSTSSSNVSHKVVLLPPATACFMTLYRDL